jgi:uncharacterized membrane protein YqaE (UPF0057 family)
VFSCFRILYVAGDDRSFKERHHLLRNYAGLITVLLTVLAPTLGVLIKHGAFTQTDLATIPTVFAALGGTLNAVAFALLFARLDSRLIGIPLSVISILYGYAALQPLFVVFDQPSSVLRAIQTSALIAALLLKICLFLITLHVLRSGRLSNYLLNFPFLNSAVNSVFDNQFEIRVRSVDDQTSFRFSVFRNNVEVYKTVARPDTREDCDKAVKEMRDAMADRENYDEPCEKYGTFWVQVRSGRINEIEADKSKRQIICESTSLREKTDAKDLIEESIEKIPYCKYDRG